MSNPPNYDIDFDAVHEFTRAQWFLTYSYYTMGAGGSVDIPLEATSENEARAEARAKWKDLMGSVPPFANHENPFAILAKGITLTYKIFAIGEAEASRDILDAQAEYLRRCELREKAK